MNKNQETLRTYEKIASQYAHIHAESETVHSHRLLFASLLKQGMIYDMGCGAGRDVYAFSQLGYQVTGFDGSKAMLAEAQKRYPDQQFKQLNMQEPYWEIEAVPDGIWACASLLHFEKEDFEKVFRQLTRLLKRTGILYFSVKVKPVLSQETVEGRFFQYYTKEWLESFVQSFPELVILHTEETKQQTDCFISYFIKKG